MDIIRLHHGQDRNEMIRRLREYQVSSESQEKGDGSAVLEIHEIVLDENVIDAIIDVIQESSNQKIDSVQFDDCGAYMNDHTIQLAKTLGSTVNNVCLLRPTFLSYDFLFHLLHSAAKLSNLRIQDRFSNQHTKAFVEGLKENKSVMTLDLSRSRFHSFVVLAEALKANTTIIDLKLRSVGLNDDNVIPIYEAIRGHPSLKVLDLSFNYCRNLDALATVIDDPGCQLKELYLGYQSLWSHPQLEFTTFARALRNNTSLKILSSARNKLRDTDILVLTTALSCNRTLQNLDLKENLITSEGICALATVLKNGTGIQQLSVTKNPFSEIGSLSLLDAVRSNYRLIQIDLSYDNILHQQIRFMAALNRGGRELLLKNPPLGLWPLIFQRINFDCPITPSDIASSCSRLDILYYMLRGPALFDGMT